MIRNFMSPNKTGGKDISMELDSDNVLEIDKLNANIDSRGDYNTLKREKAAQESAINTMDANAIINKHNAPLDTLPTLKAEDLVMPDQQPATTKFIDILRSQSQLAQQNKELNSSENKDSQGNQTKLALTDMASDIMKKMLADQVSNLS